jgi:hypothetical protein
MLRAVVSEINSGIWPRFEELRDETKAAILDHLGRIEGLALHQREFNRQLAHMNSTLSNLPTYVSMEEWDGLRKRVSDVELESNKHADRIAWVLRDLDNIQPSPSVVGGGAGSIRLPDAVQQAALNEQQLPETITEMTKRMVNEQFNAKLGEPGVTASISTGVIENEIFKKRFEFLFRNETQTALRSVESRLVMLEAFRGGGSNTFDHFGNQGFRRHALYEAAAAPPGDGGMGGGGEG